MSWLPMLVDVPVPPKRALPCTLKMVVGTVVPTPTNPFWTMNAAPDGVEDPTTNAGMVVEPEKTESTPQGELVPKPVLPLSPSMERSALGALPPLAVPLEVAMTQAFRVLGMVEVERMGW